MPVYSSAIFWEKENKKGNQQNKDEDQQFDDAVCYFPIITKVYKKVTFGLLATFYPILCKGIFSQKEEKLIVHYTILFVICGFEKKNESWVFTDMKHSVVLGAKCPFGSETDEHEWWMISGGLQIG